MIYPDSFEAKIGFDRIRELIGSHCLFEPGKEMVESMEMMFSKNEIEAQLSLVSEFKRIIDNEDSFPVQHFIDNRAALEKAAVEGAFMDVEEVNGLGKSLDSIRAILNFIKSDEKDNYPALKALCKPVQLFPFVSDRIGKILNKHGRIRDNASPELQQIRRSLNDKQSSVTKRLNQILDRARRDGLVEEDAAPTIRNGRPVIPVSAANKRKISGLVQDESATGKTVFVEPGEVVELGNEIKELEYAERREIIQILIKFAADIRPYIPELLESHSFLATIDFIRAKALFAKRLNAIQPAIQSEPGFEWQTAVHPLLFLAFKSENREVVPLSFHLTENNRILIISGPNAGGKSVCLKTVGLLQYMLQCGVLVPCGEQSKFGIFSGIYIDIGDEQSIDNDLSTYSSHLLNMKFCLKNAASDTLILIDEFGTGTEPMLGGAIAESILESLNDAGSYGVMTTHYTNLKHFATSTEGIINGAMLFDNQKMQPLYKLQVGKPGSSFAFEIARKIGLPEDVLQRSSEKVGQDHIDFDKHLREILRDKNYWEGKRKKIRQSEKKLEELMARYEQELLESEKKRKVIVREAKSQAETMLSDANKKIENTIREIKEANAEREKTKVVRQELQVFKENISAKEGAEELRVKRELAEIKKRGKELEERRPDIKQKVHQKLSDRKTEKFDPEIRVGDMVRITGQDMPGEVIELQNKKCVVVFGMIKTSVNKDQIEKMVPEEARRLKLKDQSSVNLGSWGVSARGVLFKPEIDLRGQRADEALQKVVEFIDEGIVVNRRELRILHGKGNGILRQLIREYLHSVDVVEWYGDEQVDRGGAGITVVRLGL